MTTLHARFLCGLSAMALSLSAGALAAQDLPAPDLPDRLLIVTEGAYPPFNATRPDGTVEGFEVDLGNAMCAQIGIECEWVTQSWDGIIPGLLAQQYDAIIASLYVTEERKQQILFSDKYYQVPARLVVPTDSELEISPEGLDGAIIGTQRGTTFERFITDNMPDADLRLYGTMDEAYLDLSSGRVDAVMGDVVALKNGFLDQPEGAGFEMRGPDYTDPQWFGEGAAVAVRQGQEPIADAFSAAIQALRDDGTYQEISDKWFGVDVYGG